MTRLSFVARKLSSFHDRSLFSTESVQEKGGVKQTATAMMQRHRGKISFTIGFVGGFFTGACGGFYAGASYLVGHAFR